MPDGNPGGLHEQDDARPARRGRPLAIGITVLIAIALVVLGVFIWGQLAPQRTADVPPDNTVPVTTLPQATSAVPSDLPVATGTSFTNDPSASAAQPAQTALGDMPVALSRWGWAPELGGFSVAGYVASVESGGSCTLTATNGATTVQGQAQAQPAAATTNCIVNLPVQDAAPGDWQLTMSYDGPGGTGTSETVVASVP